MKRMLKKALCIGVAGSVALSLAACGNSATSGDSSATAETSGSQDKIQIEYWSIYPVGSDGYESYNDLIMGFNESQDKYEVVHVGYPFLDYFDKMTTAFSGGVAPDVFMYTLDDVVARASTGTIMDLSPYMEAEGYDLSDYYESELRFGTYEGDYYALPLTSMCRVLYYNLDLFEAAGLTEADVPTTWDELYEVAHKMDIVEDGTIKQLGFDPTAGQSNYFTLLWQSGLDFFDENGNPVLTDQAHIDVLQWMLDFNKEYPVAQRQAFTDAGKTLSNDGFTAGTLGMMVSNDAEYKVLQNAEVPFRYGVTSLPLPENGTRVNWSSNWSIEAFNSGDPDKMAGAWEFIKYINSPESQVKQFESQGLLSARKSVNATLGGDDPIMQTFVEELNYSTEKVYWDFAPKWHEDWNQFQEQANVSGDAKSALEAAQKFYIEKKANYEATQ